MMTLEEKVALLEKKVAELEKALEDMIYVNNLYNP